tara:strand:- start:18336 stop:19160 length:825 start_codon:yes stop_codon:yes gene_type:complete
MKINSLIKKCQDLRLKNLNVCYKDGGHISTCLSTVEILVGVYYSNIFNFQNSPNKIKIQDSFILSKGHGCEIVYLILADKGFYKENFFYKNYRKNNFNFAGHINSKNNGVELSTGSLGHGLGYAAGIALANKLLKKRQKSIVLLGDAECTAGSIWEAANFSSYHNLDNLIAIIDFNKIGATERINSFTDINSLKDKWISFGWSVIEVKDGNNLKLLLHAYKKANKIKSRPIVIVANTTKGKGIKMLENDPIWHTKQIDNSNYEQALLDLKKSFK